MKPLILASALALFAVGISALAGIEAKPAQKSEPRWEYDSTVGSLDFYLKIFRSDDQYNTVKKIHLKIVNGNYHEAVTTRFTLECGNWRRTETVTVPAKTTLDDTDRLVFYPSDSCHVVDLEAKIIR